MCEGIPKGTMEAIQLHLNLMLLGPSVYFDKSTFHFPVIIFHGY